MKDDLISKINQFFENANFQYGIEIKLDGKIVFQKNSDFSFPSASLIKMAILATLMDSDIPLSQEVSLNRENIVEGSGIIQVIQPKALSVRELAGLMISVSDNSATNELIDLIGRSSVNKWLRDHFYEQTVLKRKMMDINALSNGFDNNISAHEAIRLLEQCLQFGNLTANWFLNQQFKYKLPGNFIEEDEGTKTYNKTGEGENLDHDVCHFVYQDHNADVALLTDDFAVRSEIISIFNKIGQEIVNFLKNKN